VFNCRFTEADVHLDLNRVEQNLRQSYDIIKERQIRDQVISEFTHTQTVIEVRKMFNFIRYSMD